MIKFAFAKNINVNFAMIIIFLKKFNNFKIYIYVVVLVNLAFTYKIRNIYLGIEKSFKIKFFFSKLGTQTN